MANTYHHGDRRHNDKETKCSRNLQYQQYRAMVKDAMSKVKRGEDVIMPRLFKTCGWLSN